MMINISGIYERTYAVWNCERHIIISKRAVRIYIRIGVNLYFVDVINHMSEYSLVTEWP